MDCDNATKSNRKSGVAQWRDLQFRGPVLEMFFYRAYQIRRTHPTPVTIPSKYLLHPYNLGVKC
jgi:hypothetical protein